MCPRVLLLMCVYLLLFKLIKGDNSVARPTSNSSVLQNFAGRIVNGTRAAPKQFPQQVSLRRRYTDSHFCGGSIIAPEWVLTASHCVVDKYQRVIPTYSVRVVAGEILLVNYEKAHQKSTVVRIFVHEKFNQQTLLNDVALLKLKSPFRFDPQVQPVALATHTMENWTMCKVSGWGYPAFSVHEVSYYLKYVELPLLPINLCRELLKQHSLVPDGMFCAGFPAGGRDACQGDSGGGLLCNGLLSGVVSGGEGCAWAGFPGLYADVKHYIGWIKRHVDLSRHYVISDVPQKNSNSPIPYSLSIITAIFSVILLTNV